MQYTTYGSGFLTYTKKLNSTLRASKAVEIATAMEMANKQAKDINSSHVADTLGSKPVTVNKVRSKPNKNYATKPNSGQDGFHPKQGASRSSKTSICYRCTEEHEANQCPHKSSTCYNCQKIGHIARACRKKRQQKPKTVKLVSTTAGDDEEFDLYTIKDSSSKSGILLGIQVGGTPLQMELDTGAAVTILSDTVYRKHLKAWLLQDSSVKLRTYAGESVHKLCTFTLLF